MFRSLSLAQHQIKRFGKYSYQLCPITSNPTIFQQQRPIFLDVASINDFISPMIYTIIAVLVIKQIEARPVRQSEKKHKAYLNDLRLIPTVPLNPHLKTTEGNTIDIKYDSTSDWLREKLSRSSFFLLYGPSKCGKTNAILYFIKSLQEEGYNVEYVPLREAGPEQPYLSMLKQLGDTSKGHNIFTLQTSIKDRLNVQLKKTKKKSVLIIDDAQKLNNIGFLLSLVEQGLAHVIFLTSNDDPTPSLLQSSGVRERLKLYRFLPLKDEMLNLIEQCGFTGTEAHSIFSMIDVHLGGLIEIVTKYNELKKNGEKDDLFDKTVKAVIEERMNLLLCTTNSYPGLKQELFDVFDLLPTDINGDTIRFSIKYPHLRNAVNFLDQKNILTCDNKGCYHWRYQLDALAYSQYKSHFHLRK